MCRLMCEEQTDELPYLQMGRFGLADIPRFPLTDIDFVDDLNIGMTTIDFESQVMGPEVEMERRRRGRREKR